MASPFPFILNPFTPDPLGLGSLLRGPQTPVQAPVLSKGPRARPQKPVLLKGPQAASQAPVLLKGPESPDQGPRVEKGPEGLPQVPSVQKAVTDLPTKDVYGKDLPTTFYTGDDLISHILGKLPDDSFYKWLIPQVVQKGALHGLIEGQPTHGMGGIMRSMTSVTGAYPDLYAPNYGSPQELGKETAFAWRLPYQGTKLDQINYPFHPNVIGLGSGARDISMLHELGHSVAFYLNALDELYGKTSAADRYLFDLLPSKGPTGPLGDQLALGKPIPRLVQARNGYSIGRNPLSGSIRDPGEIPSTLFELWNTLRHPDAFGGEGTMRDYLNKIGTNLPFTGDEGIVHDLSQERPLGKPQEHYTDQYVQNLVDAFKKRTEVIPPPNIPPWK